MEKIELVLLESDKELRMASAIAEFLPMVVETVYFCVAPVQETAKRKVNELRSVHLNKAVWGCPPSLPLTCPASAKVICLKSSLIPLRALCKEEDVRGPESYCLCANFSS